MLIEHLLKYKRINTKDRIGALNFNIRLSLAFVIILKSSKSSIELLQMELVVTFYKLNEYKS